MHKYILLKSIADFCQEVNTKMYSKIYMLVPKILLVNFTLQYMRMNLCK